MSRSADAHLVAGDPRDALLALAIEDRAAFADPDRFVAHLALERADLDRLDRFAAAVRATTGADLPDDLAESLEDLGPGAALAEELLARLDPAWVAAVAALRPERLDELAIRWAAELAPAGLVPPGAEPRLRELAEALVEFCAAAAAGAPATILVWEL